MLLKNALRERSDQERANRGVAQQLTQAGQAGRVAAIPLLGGFCVGVLVGWLVGFGIFFFSNAPPNDQKLVFC